MGASISVIIPFYGTAQSQRLRLTAESVLSQSGIDVDLIIAGLKCATRVKGISDLSGHPKEEVPEIVRTGEVVNNGLRLAKGDFIYVSDADILLSNQHYLNGLVQKLDGERVSLKRPPMRRLLIQDFDWFCSLVASRGLKSSVESLDFSQEYIVKPLDMERPIRVFLKHENKINKTFIVSEPDFQEYISDEMNKGSEPLYFNQDRHCGAVFAPTKGLIDVGGYHEGFISWGVWDADAQWKLENTIGVKLIPYENHFNVIHMDHEKKYFSKEKWEHDKELQAKRRLAGVECCITEDVRTFFRREYGR